MINISSEMLSKAQKQPKINPVFELYKHAKSAFESIRLFYEDFSGLTKITTDELNLYKNSLRGRGVLVERKQFTERFINSFKLTVRELYGTEIGLEKIDDFFSRIDPEKIFVIKAEEYDRVLFDWRQDENANLFKNNNHDTSKKKQDRTLKTIIEANGPIIPHRGGMDVLLRLIFLADYGDPNLTNSVLGFSASLGEELIHQLIDPVFTLQGKVPLITFVRRSAFLKQITNFEETIPENSDIYFSNPREQLAKFMTLRIMKNMFPNVDLSKVFSLGFFEAVKMGEKRAKEIGWKKILSGQIFTGHEKDYMVSED